MKITHFGHSTIGLHAPEGLIVTDPGPFSDLSCLEDAKAIILTHAHGDHLAVDAVKAAADKGTPIWGTAEVVETLGTGTVVKSGETITVLGQEIDVVGGLHEEIHPDIPRPENLGFYTDGLLHPGDQHIASDDLGDREVTTLLLAISGPWVKGMEAAEYAKSIDAKNVLPVHDALLSDIGKNVMDGFFGKVGVKGYQRINIGDDFEA